MQKHTKQKHTKQKHTKQKHRLPYGRGSVTRFGLYFVR
jgi:hypothetical protein